MINRLRTIAAVGLVFTAMFCALAFSDTSIESANNATIEKSLSQLAIEAVHGSQASSSTAREKLRAAGPAGLDILFEKFPEQVKRSTQPAVCDDPIATRWREAVEAVGRQRDGAFSRLYWYTDLDEALKAAKANHKPVLSLRLLGNLDEDQSCANSRFFRTVLYADPAVSSYLRNDYVLHWQTVRPVPVMTIDMGDGHVINRTITGNSIHYVMAGDGTVIDAIPGLWDARSFLTLIHNDAQRAATGAYVRSVAVRTQTAQVIDDNDDDEIGGANLRAVNAGQASPSKMMLERPVLRELDKGNGAAPNPLNPNSIAFAGNTAQPILSNESKRLMWQKRFGVHADLNNDQQQEVMQRMFTAFERTITADTAMNRTNLRPRILAMLADQSAARNIDSLNERVYAEVFLTPLDDPWMGLVPDDAYAALDGEGLCEPAAVQQARRPN